MKKNNKNNVQDNDSELSEKYSKCHDLINSFEKTIFDQESIIEQFNKDIDKWATDFLIKINDSDIFKKELMDVKSEYKRGVKRYKRAREAIKKRDKRHLGNELVKASKNITQVLEVLEDPFIMKYTSESTKTVRNELPIIQFQLLSLSSQFIDCLRIDADNLEQKRKELIAKEKQAKTKQEKDRLFYEELNMVKFYEILHEEWYDMNSTRTKKENRIYFVYGLAHAYLKHTNKTSLNRDKKKDEKSPFYAFVSLCFKYVDTSVNEDAIKKIIAQSKKEMNNPLYTSSFIDSLKTLKNQPEQK